MQVSFFALEKKGWRVEMPETTTEDLRVIIKLLNLRLHVLETLLEQKNILIKAELEEMFLADKPFFLTQSEE